MCGIVGMVMLNQGRIDAKLFESMVDTLTHRGPDDKGIQYFENVALGHRRLAIVDLSSSGHQPMSNEDNTLWIVYNGMIYNYIELREELRNLGHKIKSDTDTEVILHAYEEWGASCLHKFNGMFAFAIYDTKTKTLFCARDRFGIKPFYYFKDDTRFIFASEIKAIVKDPDVPRKPNPQMLYDLLIYSISDHTQSTFFEGIFNLEPGHQLILSGKNIEIKRWWELKVSKSGNSAEEDYIQEFKHIFKDAVRLRLRSDVTIGSCLSGGLDSSSIVCMLRELLGHGGNIATFSSVHPGKKVDERRYIEEVVKKVNANAFFVAPNAKDLVRELKKHTYHQEEPCGNLPSVYTQWCVMKLAQKNKVKVLLDGQGADEMLCGYHYFFSYYFLTLLHERKFGVLLREIVQYLIKHRRLFAIMGFVFLLLPDDMRRRLYWHSKIVSEEFIRKYEKESQYAKFLNNAKFLDEQLKMHFEIKLRELLRFEDKNAMAFGIETRLPFLDFRLVQMIFNLPANLKIRDGETKYILRRALRNIVPEFILSRQDKLGFPGLDVDWLLAPEMRKTVESIIFSEAFDGRGIFDVESVRRCWRKFCEGDSSLATDIWKFVNIELWYQIFIDGSGEQEVG